MSDVITYPLSAAIELCEQLDNNLPTPETDDLARGNHVVPTEWAQKLERERDKAIEATKKAKAYKRVLKVTNAQLKRERDKARKKIEQQRLEIVRLNGATNHAGGTPLKIALRERDEAREEVKLLKAILDLIKKDLS